MLKQRVITGLILGALVLAFLLLLPPAWFLSFAAFALLVAAWEWSRLAMLASITLRFAYLTLVAALLALLALQHAGQRELVLLAGCLWWVFAFYLIRRFPALGAHWRHPGLLAAVGLLVLLPGWTALLHLADSAWHASGILLLLVLVAAADVGAYFAGRALGRHKLAVNVSPNKTWEGFAGGLLLCSAVALLAWLFWRPADTYGFAAVLRVLAAALSVAVFSVVGDLFESMVKRQAGVKDSGTLLPGHGGVLDRIDSITAALPLYALALQWAVVP